MGLQLFGRQNVFIFYIDELWHAKIKSFASVDIMMDSSLLSEPIEILFVVVFKDNMSSNNIIIC